ncbi:MAG TPA: L,D-transpeptidase family protein [Pontiella sp.]
MAKPIYAGSYPNRGFGRWKNVFIIIVLIQIAVVVVLMRKNDKADSSEEPAVQSNEPAAALPFEPAPSAPIPPAVASPETAALLSDARAALDAGQLIEAKRILDRAVESTGDAEAVRMLGDVNIQLLKSPLMMPGKEYYAIQGGDYLQKIAGMYNTTVPLIQAMNGLETDVIRRGARLLVYRGDFSIRVSKSRNTLDLMAGDRLFKRYPVGTGKFGKTPAIEFTIVDKIVEPPWTRPADNKQIEYGDPENVLGTRWMKIVSDDHPEITGFGIHGTWERDSIGEQSSAGCIRMLNEDVEELFDLVPRKTPVVISE